MKWALWILVWMVAGEAIADEGHSVRDFCRSNPTRAKWLLDQLDYSRPELAKIKVRMDKGDLISACEELLKHYKEAPVAKWLRAPLSRSSAATDPEAEQLQRNQFCLQGVAAFLPRRPDGRFNWNFCGPKSDPEWAWLLNRHDFFCVLLDAYEKTGNRNYSRCFNELVQDWISANPYSSRSGSMAWRAMETGWRLGQSWPQAFFGFQHSEDFCPATRLDMLASVCEQMEFCRRSHAEGGNHLLREMNGLASAALCWPEFKASSSYFDYALAQIMNALREQLLPDGAQKELSNHYQLVSLDDFENFVDLCRKTGRHSVADRVEQKLEEAWNYFFYVMRPDGFGPLNNDADLEFNRKYAMSPAAVHHREDWKFIATNGRQGEIPRDLSIAFPWAGQFLLRSGWDANARWSFFDCGPSGIAHRHRDKLNFTAYAYGRELLVDSGRFSYKHDIWRSYFTGSAAHNVILVDGHGQKNEPDVLSHPLPENDWNFQPELSYAYGSYERGFQEVSDPVKHDRAVLLVRGQYWIVVDQITCFGLHTIEPLWHFHPDCNVAVEGDSVLTKDPGRGNLRISPAGTLSWKVDLARGRERPAIQGWYSSNYNRKVPNTTAVYETRIHHPVVFAWVLVPSRDVAVPLSIHVFPSSPGVLRFGVESPELGCDEIEVRMKNSFHRHPQFIVVHKENRPGPAIGKAEEGIHSAAKANDRVPTNQPAFKTHN